MSDRSMTRTVGRRDFLGLGGAVLLASTAIAGCDRSGDPGEGPGSTEGLADSAVKEAPQLAEMVASGDLPPLAERLPENPMVVEPVEQIGVYGGQWRTAMLGAADFIWLQRTVGSEGLLRRTPDFKVISNVAESYEVSEDGTGYTFRFRAGMKWSDGEPYGPDDIVFAQNDVFNNRELYPAEPANPLTAEKLDENTVRLTFVHPEGLFIDDQAGNGGQDIVRLPAHYLKNFHADYNPDIDQLVEQEEAADWPSLFKAKAGLGPGRVWTNVEMPVIYGWKTVTALGEGTRVVVDRNPYYWKVDPEGRQLPYIDQVSIEVVNDAEVILLKAMAGEIDMQDRNLGTPQNKPPLAANRERGDYKFFVVKTTEMNTTGLALNLTHQDPVKREIFNNKDFRIGLSHAINRQEVVDVAFQRQGQPWQLCPRPESRYQNEQLATQYTGYDLDLANQHLDRAGYERDSSGFRLGPNGERIAFTLTFVNSWTPVWPDVAEMLRGYWAEVGVDVNLLLQDRSLWDERGKANDFDVTIWAGQFGGDIDALIRPMWYVPIDGFVSPAPLWREWYRSQGEGGEEPPEPVRQTMSLYDQINATPDQDAHVDLMNEILDINAEMFNSIGVSLSPDKYGIVKNNLHNVPESMPDAGPVFQQPGPTNPEQYFFS